MMVDGVHHRMMIKMMIHNGVYLLIKTKKKLRNHLGMIMIIKQIILGEKIIMHGNHNGEMMIIKIQLGEIRK